MAKSTLREGADFISQLKSVGVDAFVPGLHHIEEVVSKINELLQT